MTRILVVDDEKDIRELVRDILTDEGFDVLQAATSTEAINTVKDNTPDLIVLDIWLKDSALDGIGILGVLSKSHPEIPVIVISGHANAEIAVAAIKGGAYDFIEKPFNTDHFLVVVDRANEASRLRRENMDLRNKTGLKSELIGSSPATLTLISQIDKVAKTNGRVFLTGPSGSGKEVVARKIHLQSIRRNNPFFAVSCASLSGQNFEDILLGHALPDTRPGLLEQATGGVVFLDEVCDLPHESQAKILRILVDTSITTPSRKTIPIDVRIIAATNKDVSVELREGRLREDLYHRLNVIPIEVPSLSLRSDDIPPLVAHFTAQFEAEQNLRARDFDEDALLALQTHNWPGNVRELRNIIERILILGKTSAPVTAEEVHTHISTADAKFENGIKTFAGMNLREAREEFEKDYLLFQINRFNGNISRTAEFIKMERSALHRKLKSLGVGATLRHRLGADATPSGKDR